MPFNKDSLSTLITRNSALYESLYTPTEKTPRHSLLKVFASVDAGIEHQLLGGLDFLAKQIFPGSARGSYLRAHWSFRVPPLYGSASSGNVTFSGIANSAIPSGVLLKTASGAMYYTASAAKINADGTASVPAASQDTGVNTNLDAGEKLSICSSLPSGVDTEAVVSTGGFTGGADPETDDEYLARVLWHLRNPAPYGKKGDFAGWAMDASPEVSAAWEFPDYDADHSLLIQVINGTQETGVSPAGQGGINIISAYIKEIAPPVMFLVNTPAIIMLNPKVLLPAGADTNANRELARSKLTACVQRLAAPDTAIYARELTTALQDSVALAGTAVLLGDAENGCITATKLQYPYIGAISWERQS